MRILSTALVALALVGCGSGHSTTGVVARGDGAPVVQAPAKTTPKPTVTAPVTPVASNALAMVKRHTPQPGRVIRWPTKVINIDSSAQVVLDALPRLAGLGLRYAPGRAGGIRFRGYSTARNSVGWSSFNYRNGRITSCDIWLNPKWVRRYSPSKTLSHEILHCTGFDGHTKGRSLMDKYGRGEITNDIRAWAKLLYTLQPGSRI